MNKIYSKDIKRIKSGSDNETINSNIQKLKNSGMSNDTATLISLKIALTHRKRGKNSRINQEQGSNNTLKAYIPATNK